jgi:hypothetical protein
MPMWHVGFVINPKPIKLISGSQHDKNISDLFNKIYQSNINHYLRTTNQTACRSEYIDFTSTTILVKKRAIQWPR